jgi:hypothetical protein
VRTYRISVTAQLTPSSAVDVARLRVLVAARVDAVANGVLRIDLTSRGRDARCAAERALSRLDRALAPSVRFARPPVWVARRRGPLRLWRTATGHWSVGGDPDDGLGGVREPRRPRPPSGSATAVADPHAA